jgi:hypothetical protein
MRSRVGGMQRAAADQGHRPQHRRWAVDRYGAGSAGVGGDVRLGPGRSCGQCDRHGIAVVPLTGQQPGPSAPVVGVTAVVKAVQLSFS